MQQDGRTSLFISAREGHTGSVLALLQAGAAVDAKKKVQGLFDVARARSLCGTEGGGGGGGGVYVCLHMFLLVR